MSPVWRVVYCEGWDSGALVGRLSEATARRRDAAGQQYAVALCTPDQDWPEVLIEVCWEALYAAAWRFDDDGRRHKKVEWRQLADDELFLLTSAEWTYDEEAPSEFDERAAYRELRHDPDGSGSDSFWRLGERAGGLSRRGIKTDVAQLFRSKPEFGDWAGLAQLEGVLEVQETEDEERDAPWQPPRPLQPRNVDVMFEDGATLTHPDFDDVVITVEEAGDLVLPTGALVVHDPAWLEFTDHAVTFELSPGTYPVQLSVLRVPDEGGGMTVGARILLRDQPVTSWEMAVPVGKNAALLGDRQFYAFGVDAGMACFVDHAALESFQEVGELEVERDEALVLTNKESTATLIAFSSGYGDGAYPSWIGRTEDGEIGCFVADLMVLAKAQPR
ncbi:DUF4241 domain-containing protein [Kutzneria chonburiensis]|uniref:DUF4241 domain-containing protein n=1 Tax=Kutzneria chonburiensis TaxID=1483604 RepID=A0ABV6MV39_9PSEU|nr:DUF4241 domain-containing protein [Kutzneria chonburiensis]